MDFVCSILSRKLSNIIFCQQKCLILSLTMSLFLFCIAFFVAPGSATFRAAPEKPGNDESLMRLLRGAELDGLLPI